MVLLIAPGAVGLIWSNLLRFPARCRSGESRNQEDYRGVGPGPSPRLLLKGSHFAAVFVPASGLLYWRYHECTHAIDGGG